MGLSTRPRPPKYEQLLAHKKRQNQAQNIASGIRNKIQKKLVRMNDFMSFMILRFFALEDQGYLKPACGQVQINIRTLGTVFRRIDFTK